MKNSSCGGRTYCIQGVLLPIWTPENPAVPERLARAAVYFLALVYLFLGVSIIADRFMASIEVITSQERKVSIRTPSGDKVITRVRVWNETVSNLTLMALGSSAPEILLSVVEVCGHGFNAGELGPNTIVGSAAFNMFVIIGLCVSVVPEGQTRRVKHLGVFFVTAAWSIFAYAWLYLILAVSTPGVVQVWEGLLTLLFFPVCVGVAYLADRHLSFYRYVSKRYRAGRRRGVIVETEGEPEGGDPGARAGALQEEATIDLETLEDREGTFSVCRTGTGPVLKRSTMTTNHGGPENFSTTLLLESTSCVALELRCHEDLKTSVLLDHQTGDGMARAGSDESLEKISTAVMDHQVLQADEHFLVHLRNARLVSEGGQSQDHLVSWGTPSLPGPASISENAGVFTFEEKTLTVSKNIGVMEVKVLRTSGARGLVAVPYGTRQGSARGGGENFEDTRGVLEFDDNETW